MPAAPPLSSRFRSPVFALVVLLLVLLLPSALAPTSTLAARPASWEAQPVRSADIRPRDAKLVGQLPGTARLGYHPQTGRVRSISGTPSQPLGRALPGVAAGKRRLTVADARTKARRFVDRYGSLFGLSDPGRELRLRSTQRRLMPASGRPADAGAGLPNTTVRFEQMRGGVPVMGGALVVQLGGDGEVISAAGEVLPSATEARTSAKIGPRHARTTASRWLARELGRGEAAVASASEGLALYDPRVMDDPVLAGMGARLVWRIDARVPTTGGKQAERRLVIIDALGGQVLTSIGRTYTAEGPNRRICDNGSRPGRPWACNGPFARVEGQPPTSLPDVDAAYRLMGVTYDYFFSRFGRDGVDGKGSPMKATVRYCPRYGCPWRNAEWRWGPQQATFGRGWSKADDIVAHEYTHGVLDAEAPLFYHYQSGAINESLADVFGELIDLAYPGGNDAPRQAWKIGEDTPVGAFRDMRDPKRHGHPDRVRSPKWQTGSGDFGGVHRNSGVGNKTAYLMSAGGSFRGHRIAGIGKERTARVWYQALTTRLTPAANYVDLADALVSACTDLAGTNGITLPHCKAVRDATRATQMNLVPKRLPPATAPVCGPTQTPIDVFRDDLENPTSGAWVTLKTVGAKKGWFWPQNPNDSPGWDGTWASSGKLNFYAPNHGTRMDSTMRMTAPVELPPGAFLRFGHGYSFDRDSKRRYDGGVVEIKVNDGPWRGVGSLITHGKYNGTLAKGHGNTLAGKRAWTGNSRGWSKARVDLRPFAGSRVWVRFRMASDRRVGARGWYIDDVRIYTCRADHDKPSGTLVINADAPTTTSNKVLLDLTWADASTRVTKVRISGSARMTPGGNQLFKGITLPVRERVAWNLAGTTYGGPGTPGTRRVFAQVRDASGNWSAVFSDVIEWVAP